MRKLVDLHPVLDLITDKLNGDRQELRRILDARNADELRDFEKQDRLLDEIHPACGRSTFSKETSTSKATSLA